MKTRLNVLLRLIMVIFKNCCYVRSVLKRLRYSERLWGEGLKIVELSTLHSKWFLFQSDMLWCGLWEERIRIPIRRSILKCWFYVKSLINIEGLYPNILTISMVLTLTNQNKCLSHQKGHSDFNNCTAMPVQNGRMSVLLTNGVTFW